ncbi:MAG TPA: hypothetical protein VMM78_14325 [Thermomicrobiales bacterium]|nr:hypothetical protein [Thermomicrobiales bacterium]
MLVDGIEALRAITGDAPAGYRSPAWAFSANTLDLLRQYGFVYSSNLMSDFVPWTYPGTNLIELPVQWILDDAPFFLFGAGQNRPISSAENVYQVWTEEFRGVYRHGGLFNLTMHPQLIGRTGRLMMLERFIDFAQGFPEIWFPTGVEVAAHWR